jgi:hypothetical protein
MSHPNIISVGDDVIVEGDGQVLRRSLGNVLRVR